ncbi:MAG: O-antigen ligase family protein [Planctomycetota bacterium]
MIAVARKPAPVQEEPLPPSPDVTEGPGEETAGDALRWWRIGVVAAVMAAVFYAYEHEPAMYAGGARGGLREDRLLDQFVDGAESGSLKRKVALLGFGLFGVVAVVASRDQKWNLQWFGIGVLSLLLLWTAASVGWSNQAGISLRRLIAAGITLTGALGVARLLKPDELVTAALASMLLLVTASFAIDLAAGGRPWRGDYRFAGTLHANTQATYCAVLCLAASCQRAAFGTRWMPRLAFAIGFVGIVLTKSRTALLAIVLGLFVATAVRFTRGMRWAFIALAISLAAFAAVTVASLGDGERTQIRDTALMGRTEQAGSLTGRVPLWEELIDYAAKRPLMGYGYEGFWTAKRIDSVMRSQGWTLQSAHNSYLEFTLQTGLIGLALGLLLLFVASQALHAAFELSGVGGYAFAAGLLGIGLADGLLQSHFVVVSYPTVIAAIAVLNVLCFFPASIHGEDADESVVAQAHAA